MEDNWCKRVSESATEMGWRLHIWSAENSVQPVRDTSQRSMVGGTSSSLSFWFTRCTVDEPASVLEVGLETWYASGGGSESTLIVVDVEDRGTLAVEGSAGEWLTSPGAATREMPASLCFSQVSLGRHDNYCAVLLIIDHLPSRHVYISCE